MMADVESTGTRPIKERHDLHISRKIFHNLGILSILVVYHNLSYQNAIQLSLLFTVAITAFDFLRLKTNFFSDVTMKLFRRVMRENELNEWSATTYLMYGVSIVVLIFPREVATLALGLLAFGDPISSIVGVQYGKDKILGNKSLQGTLAGFVTCTIVSGLFYYSKGIMLERIVLVSILSGLIGAISELIPVGKLDDNLSFPVIAACLLFGLFSVFGGFA
jgi:dolichol kinase